MKKQDFLMNVECFNMGFNRGYATARKDFTEKIINVTQEKEKDFCFKCKYNKKKICQLPVDDRRKCPIAITLLKRSVK